MSIAASRHIPQVKLHWRIESAHLKKAPAGIYCIEEIAPDNFQRSRYFLEYYSQTSLADEIALVLYPSPLISIHICLGKDRNSRGKFSAKEVEAARTIFPIAESLAVSHWRKLNQNALKSKETSLPDLAVAAKVKLGIHLSRRQAEVAMLVLQGHSSNSIGNRLGISPQTVKVFRKQLYKKCKISSQAQLFSLFLPIMISGKP